MLLYGGARLDNRALMIARRLYGGPIRTYASRALAACAVLQLALAACSGEDAAPEANAGSVRPTPSAASMPPDPGAGTTTGGAPTPAGGGSEAPAAPVGLSGGAGMSPSGAGGPPGANASSDAGASPTSDAGATGAGLTPVCERDVTEANKALVTTAIDELFVQGDITAVDRYWGEPYFQHNPNAASGVETFRNLFGGLVSPGNPIYALERVTGECELVLIHGAYTTFGGPTFDMFRVQDNRIVEHWDAAALGAGPNASGRTALDGATIVTDVELTTTNEALVLGFVDNVLIPQAYADIGDYVSPELIEHNPESEDGAEAYVRHLESNAITYRQIHHEIADGNFVFVLSEGSVGETSVALYDLFRVEASRIVEHWDARRDVPATTASGLGVF